MNERQQLQARHHAQSLEQKAQTPKETENEIDFHTPIANSPLDYALRQVLQYQAQLKQANQDIDDLLKHAARGKKLNSALLTDAHARQKLAIHQLSTVFAGLFAQHPELATYIRKHVSTSSTATKETSHSADVKHKQ